MDSGSLQLPGARRSPVPTRAHLEAKMQKQYQSALENVKENFTRLQQCEGPHDFQPRPGGRRGEYQCVKCQGNVTGANAWFYTHGLTHGKKLSE